MPNVFARLLQTADTSSRVDFLVSTGKKNVVRSRAYGARLLLFLRISSRRAAKTIAAVNSNDSARSLAVTMTK
jgi:hypothetical protein